MNGAALDRYITGNYGEDQFRGVWDEGYPPFRCRHCGRWLKMEPDRVRAWEEAYPCDDVDCLHCTDTGETKHIVWAGTHDGRKCRACGRWSVTVTA